MRSLLFSVLASVLLQFAFAQSYDPAIFNSLKWRMIGPHRGGRTVGAVGVPSLPNVFYIGVNNGGVWKTTDFGRTWVPIFDSQPTGSIGDIAVAPSDPEIIYVGSGEGLQRPDLSVGNGVYRSANGGKTWTHLGFEHAQQIGGMDVDRKNADRLFVAVLGHPYGPNPERGVYRTLDGGKTWKQVFYIDENTGAIQVTIDPVNPNIIYTAMWAGRQGPWENGAWNGPNSGLFKSTDGGETWRKLEKGLPTTAEGLGRIGFTIAPSDNSRLYATVDAGANGGIYRSDDGGENWRRIQTDNRYWGRASDFAELKVDPKNKDIVYSANIVTWKSVNGGESWTAFRGAPGGDDYHRIWINPTDPKIILLASDQGAIITVNGGETYSSWYNQPTAQFYHVSTDNAFPYNVYGGQQESGSVGIASRGNDGQISYREWHPVGVEEYGYVAPDPLDHNIIYGGKITKFDKRTGQVQNIAPEAVRSGKYRFLRTAPVLFSPVDPKTLYFAGNVLFKTKNGGNSWTVISPDLSREAWDIPESVGIYTDQNMKTMPRRGVIYTVAPSFKDSNTIWCSTDDGLIHVTRNGGKTWKNVTPPEITSWSKVSLIEASHFDVNTAYAAVNRIRVDDMRPHIYKTTDGGKTWKKIVRNLPADPINVVREDPRKKGLLYAGSETAVYVSFDDGENWMSLRKNMPATSIRDLVIKDDDIVVGTHGRSFWIMDDITPLRQIDPQLAASPVILFKPQQAWRVRWRMYTDTPIPQEEPAGENPPDGAVINYYLKNDIARELTVEIMDAKGNLVRKYSSGDKPYVKPADNVPDYWVRPQAILTTSAGARRWLWDMRYAPLDVPQTYPIGAVYKNTAPNPTAPFVMPGIYSVRLTADGKSITQTFSVKMDPRVKTPIKDLQAQHDLSKQLYDLRKAMLAIKPATNEAMQERSRLLAQSANVFNILQDTDMPPTSQAKRDAAELMAKMKKILTK
jgi:photosystem II stability/assembly factor-like uncharacterized protein